MAWYNKVSVKLYSPVYGVCIFYYKLCYILIPKVLRDRVIAARRYSFSRYQQPSPSRAAIAIQPVANFARSIIEVSILCAPRNFRITILTVYLRASLSPAVYVADFPSESPIHVMIVRVCSHLSLGRSVNAPTETPNEGTHFETRVYTYVRTYVSYTFKHRFFSHEARRQPTTSDETASSQQEEGKK